MKIAPRSFQIFWDAHAWVGVVGALVLFVSFFLGAFALFNLELNLWADPAAVGPAPAPARLAPLVEQLVNEEQAIGQKRMAFMIEPTGVRSYLSKGRNVRQYRLAHDGRLERVRSEIGQFVFDLHYLEQLPGGVYFAGLAGMSLLLTLLTGLLIHLKDLVRHWFQLRPAREPRTVAGDVHKVLGVLGLPFQLFFAWSGTVLAIGVVLVDAPFVISLFGGDIGAAVVARGEAAAAAPTPTGQRAPVPDLDAMLVRVRAAVPGIEPNWIAIEHVGDEASVISVFGDLHGVAFGAANVIVRATDGAVLYTATPTSASSFQRFEAWFYGLHYVRFGGHGMKLIYALLALATCAVIVTGNLIWLERRDRKRARLGNRLLQRLTVACCAGLPLATAALLVANRVLAASAASGIAREEAVFWVAWGGAAVVPLVWHASRRVAGFELVAAGCLYLLAPALDLATNPGRLGVPIHVVIDLVLALVGVACIAGGMRLLRPRGPRGIVGQAAPGALA